MSLSLTGFLSAPLGVPDPLQLTPLSAGNGAAPPAPPQFTYQPISLMEPDPLLSGNGTTADYNQAIGGDGSAYVANQTPYDVADNGAVSTTPTSSTSAAPTWLSALTSLGSGVTAVTGAVSPLINGKPANSPANPGAQPNASGTVATATASKLPWIIGGVIVVILGVVLFWKKK